MNQKSSTLNTEKPASAAFTPAQLRVLAAQIVASGVLGRSKKYAALLDFLVESSIESKSPKEIELAISVLGKNESFDVSSDASVRVYVHQLRKKLDIYYRDFDKSAAYRIIIPKGQYTVAAIGYSSPSRIATGKIWSFAELFKIKALLITAVILLSANLIYLIGSNSDIEPDRLDSVSSHAIWRSVLEDQHPIMLVMGDYYIFGELNANGNVARMVREFNVNSRSDLENLQFQDIELAENYLDLDLSYMPEGSAYALARIVPILRSSNKTVNITMMSDLSAADIRDNHIVYIGYISALEKLTQMTFASSGLQIGRSYDELVDKQSLQFFTSDAGLPEDGEQFRDYGMFSTYPASSETQVVMIAGMRDAGLMHTAKALSETQFLDDLVVAIDDDTDEAVASFEALFEVYGVDRLNFEANLVYVNSLDVSAIWSHHSGL
ncbi:MAG: hypothetical protein ACI9E4_001194 [Pseudohongiellaceae bacterium]|jgi:hypothetical protein